MDTYFYIATISVLILLILVGTNRKKKMLGRVFYFQYAIEEKRQKLTWRTFILFALLLLVILTNWLDIGFTIFSIFIILIVLYEAIQSKKLNPKSYLISGSKLIYNGWSVKEFDLKELEYIRFLPFRDSFKFIFKNKKSIVMARYSFDGSVLSNFIQRVIELSPEKVYIEEDAKSKIYV